MPVMCRHSTLCAVMRIYLELFCWAAVVFLVTQRTKHMTKAAERKLQLCDGATIESCMEEMVFYEHVCYDTWSGAGICIAHPTASVDKNFKTWDFSVCAAQSKVPAREFPRFRKVFMDAVIENCRSSGEGFKICRIIGYLELVESEMELRDLLIAAFKTEAWFHSRVEIVFFLATFVFLWMEIYHRAFHY